MCTDSISDPTGGVLSPVASMWQHLIANRAALFSELYSSCAWVASVCDKVQGSCGQQLWKMFLILYIYKWQKFIKITSVGMGAAKSNETR